MELKKYKQDVKYGTYSQKDVLKILPKEKIYFQLKHQWLSPSKNLNCVISTQVSGWWLLRRRFLLALDCDSFADKEKATEELRLLNIKYKIWLSSPNHYWIVTNFVGSFKKCLAFLLCIPGVDREFVDYCSKYEMITLRAFPKEGYRPNLWTNYDTFDGEAGEWVEEFKKYWGGSPIVQWLIQRQREEIDAAKHAFEEKVRLEIAQEEEKRKQREESKPRRNLRVNTNEI